MSFSLYDTRGRVENLNNTNIVMLADDEIKNTITIAEAKNVTLNLELSKYDINALNYVIVHELSHFIHPNHSKEFWNLVSKYYPNYKEARKYLKTNP